MYESLQIKRSSWHTFEGYHFKQEKKFRNIADNLEILGIILAIFSIVITLGVILPYFTMVAVIINMIFSWKAKQSHELGEYARRTSFYIGFIDDSLLQSIARRLIEGKKWNFNDSDYFYDIGIKDNRIKFAKDFCESLYFQTRLMEFEKKQKWKKIIKIALLIFGSITGIISTLSIYPELSTSLLLPFLIIIIPFSVNEIFKVYRYNKRYEKVQNIQDELHRLIKKKHYTNKLLFGCFNLEMEYSIALIGLESISDKMYNKFKPHIQKEVEDLINNIF